MILRLWLVVVLILLFFLQTVPLPAAQEYDTNELSKMPIYDQRRESVIMNSVQLQQMIEEWSNQKRWVSSEPSPQSADVLSYGTQRFTYAGGDLLTNARFSETGVNGVPKNWIGYIARDVQNHPVGSIEMKTDPVTGEQYLSISATKGPDGKMTAYPPTITQVLSSTLLQGGAYYAFTAIFTGSIADAVASLRVDYKMKDKKTGAYLKDGNGTTIVSMLTEGVRYVGTAGHRQELVCAFQALDDSAETFTYEYYLRVVGNKNRIDGAFTAMNAPVTIDYYGASCRRLGEDFQSAITADRFSSDPRSRVFDLTGTRAGGTGHAFFTATVDGDHEDASTVRNGYRQLSAGSTSYLRLAGFNTNAAGYYDDNALIRLHYKIVGQGTATVSVYTGFENESVYKSRPFTDLGTLCAKGGAGILTQEFSLNKLDPAVIMKLINGGYSFQVRTDAETAVEFYGVEIVSLSDQQLAREQAKQLLLAGYQPMRPPVKTDGVMDDAVLRAARCTVFYTDDIVYRYATKPLQNDAKNTARGFCAKGETGRMKVSIYLAEGVDDLTLVLSGLAFGGVAISADQLKVYLEECGPVRTGTYANPYSAKTFYDGAPDYLREVTGQKLSLGPGAYTFYIEVPIAVNQRSGTYTGQVQVRTGKGERLATAGMSLKVYDFVALPPQNETYVYFDPYWTLTSTQGVDAALGLFRNTGVKPFVVVNYKNIGFSYDKETGTFSFDPAVFAQQLTQMKNVGAANKAVISVGALADYVYYRMYKKWQADDPALWQRLSSPEYQAAFTMMVKTIKEVCQRTGIVFDVAVVDEPNTVAEAILAALLQPLVQAQGVATVMTNGTSYDADMQVPRGSIFYGKVPGNVIRSDLVRQSTTRYIVISLGSSANKVGADWYMTNSDYLRDATNELMFGALGAAWDVQSYYFYGFMTPDGGGGMRGINPRANALYPHFCVAYAQIDGTIARTTAWLSLQNGLAYRGAWDALSDEIRRAKSSSAVAQEARRYVTMLKNVFTGVDNNAFFLTGSQGNGIDSQLNTLLAQTGAKNLTQIREKLYDFLGRLTAERAGGGRVIPKPNPWIDRWGGDLFNGVPSSGPSYFFNFRNQLFRQTGYRMTPLSGKAALLQDTSNSDEGNIVLPYGSKKIVLPWARE